MHIKALLALWDAAEFAVQEHKRYNMPLVIMENGKIKEVSPEEAEERLKKFT